MYLFIIMYTYDNDFFSYANTTELKTSIKLLITIMYFN